MALNEQELDEVLGWLGYRLRDFAMVGRGARSLNEASDRLEALKQDVRRAAKRVWFEAHPDRAGDSPEATERLSKLTRAMKGIESMTVMARPEPKPVRVQPFAGFTDTGTSTATITDMWSNPSDWPWS